MLLLVRGFARLLGSARYSSTFLDDSRIPTAIAIFCGISVSVCQGGY